MFLGDVHGVNPHQLVQLAGGPLGLLSQAHTQAQQGAPAHRPMHPRRQPVGGDGVALQRLPQLLESAEGVLMSAVGAAFTTGPPVALTTSPIRDPSSRVNSCGTSANASRVQACTTPS